MIAVTDVREHGAWRVVEVVDLRTMRFEDYLAELGPLMPHERVRLVSAARTMRTVEPEAAP